jgi:hypothetical protein
VPADVLPVVLPLMQPEDPSDVSMQPAHGMSSSHTGARSDRSRSPRRRESIVDRIATVERRMATLAEFDRQSDAIVAQTAIQIAAIGRSVSHLAEVSRQLTANMAELVDVVASISRRLVV